MKRLEIKGIDFAEITLHVGVGTFNPIEVEDLSKHKMESEEAIITQENADIINKAVEEGRRVCAIGTTTMRTIETSVSSNRKIGPYHGWTNKFIFPPHDFGVANCMITNFHTPKSTLMMMVAAFAGKESNLGTTKGLESLSEAQKEAESEYSNLNFLLSDIRTLAKNKEINSVECAGKITVKTSNYDLIYKVTYNA